jgi:hypothetical protein
LEDDADVDLENQVIPVTDEVRAQVELFGANEPRQLIWYNRHGDVNGDGQAWDAGHTTAEADCETQSVLHEIDDATVREEKDVENQEWDPEQQVPNLDVVDDITGVYPHIGDVVESLDEYHDIEVKDDGDVNEHEKVQTKKIWIRLGLTLIWIRMKIWPKKIRMKIRPKEIRMSISRKKIHVGVCSSSSVHNESRVYSSGEWTIPKKNVYSTFEVDTIFQENR